MAWEGSDRRSRLPGDWPSRRIKVLRRDRFTCRLIWGGCLRDATEVDHIKPGDDHRLSNLQAVCTPCHTKKSAAEGRAARERLRRLRYRSPGRHPGRRAVKEGS